MLVILPSKVQFQLDIKFVKCDSVSYQIILKIKGLKLHYFHFKIRKNDDNVSLLMANTRNSVRENRALRTLAIQTKRTVKVYFLMKEEQCK